MLNASGFVTESVWKLEPVGAMRSLVTSADEWLRRCLWAHVQISLAACHSIYGVATVVLWRGPAWIRAQWSRRGNAWHIATFRSFVYACCTPKHAAWRGF
jgi:hypothetical protein